MCCAYSSAMCLIHRCVLNNACKRAKVTSHNWIRQFLLENMAHSFNKANHHLTAFKRHVNVLPVDHSGLFGTRDNAGDVHDVLRIGPRTFEDFDTMSTGGIGILSMSS